VRAIYSERYRQLANALVLTRHAERLLLDLLPNLIEIREQFVYVKELAPFHI
jgi:hypothetical protein